MNNKSRELSSQKTIGSLPVPFDVVLKSAVLVGFVFAVGRCIAADIVAPGII